MMMQTEIEFVIFVVAGITLGISMISNFNQWRFNRDLMRSHLSLRESYDYLSLELKKAELELRFLVDRKQV